ncbi:MAG: GumC family protein [Limisphaerales bacterium]
MIPKQAIQASSGLTLGDVYYILFRHKWLIAILSLVALTAAILVVVLSPLPYLSEAKVLIKYVKETKPLEQTAIDSQVTTPDSRGENIINSEIEILTSLDLANTVADNLTPAKILAKAGGGTNRSQAAILIKKNLTAEVGKRSDVISLVFFHPDPDMVQPILGQIIETYLKRHSAIHRPEWNEFLTLETDEIKHKLDDTETQLREARAKANIISLDDSRKTLGDMTAKIQQEIYDAEAEWAGYRQTILDMQGLLPKPVVATNTAPSVEAAAPIPADKVDAYQRVCQQLSALQSQEQDLLLRYTTNNSLVQTKQGEVARAEALKKQLEGKFPGLTAMKPVETRGAATPSAPAVDPAVALNEEIRKADALAAKVKVLTNELAEVRANAALMTEQEGTISQLQRDKELQAAEFSYYSRRLEESRANEALGPGNSNISIVESPTPPARDMLKLYKLAAGILCGALVFAFGLPFLIELYLDRSLKHPLEVQARLGLPFFITIPATNGTGGSHTHKEGKKRALLPGKTGEAGEAQAAPPADGALALWEKGHGLQPFYETLRDRLMTYFEVINLTHKPKLVAVTSCAAGAGVTSTAVGLASTLSETGDGNVLLVNMNVRDGEAHHFYKGKLACGLDEVLEKEKREGALVQDNLYVAKEQENDSKLPRILPKRFSHLLPKMKASDFDYIIFDMPPVSQISITPKLARFMDMVLLVVESEKTDRDVAKRVASMLSETKTNVGIVLNKNRSYLPRRLQQEI